MQKLYEQKIAQYKNEEAYRSPSKRKARKNSNFLQRVHFYASYFAITVRARRLALRGQYSDELYCWSSWDIISLVERFNGLVTVTGSANLKQDRPFIIASNHMGLLETHMFSALISPYKPISFVVKESLTRGYFGPVIRSRPYISVSRKDPGEDLEKIMKEGKKILDQGRSIVIFPQSNRDGRSFDSSKFNSIATRLAAHAGYPVIPTAVKTDFWLKGRHKLLSEFGPISNNEPIKIEFGRPIYVEGRGRQENKEIIRFISSKMQEWGLSIIQ